MTVIMKLLAILIVVALVAAQTSTSNLADSEASAAASTSTSPEYTITALSAVQSAPSYVFNCLIPIGLADPSGCDACLSAPAGVLDFLIDCRQNVCASSTSVYGASATSLYDIYCQSVYGNATISQAFVTESSVDAAAALSSSIASVEASSTITMSSSNARSALGSSATTSGVGSGGSVWPPSLLAVGFGVVGGLTVLLLCDIHATWIWSKVVD